jgi:hypothetical protein
MGPASYADRGAGKGYSPGYEPSDVAIKRAAAAAYYWIDAPINADRRAYTRERDAESDRAPRSRVPFGPNPDAAAQATQSSFV